MMRRSVCRFPGDGGAPRDGENRPDYPDNFARWDEDYTYRCTRCWKFFDAPGRCPDCGAELDRVEVVPPEPVAMDYGPPEMFGIFDEPEETQ